jgi:hypothetical protein
MTFDPFAYRRLHFIGAAAARRSSSADGLSQTAERAER